MKPVPETMPLTVPWRTETCQSEEINRLAACIAGIAGCRYMDRAISLRAGDQLR
jgi:hypothetical protein